MKALLVDGDPVVQRLIKSHLSREGILTTAVSDIASALAALGLMDFDLVILDPTLPDGSGFSLLEVLHQSMSPPHAIVISGATAEADRVRALQFGADDYVTKPFYARELAARALAVRRRIERARKLALRYGWLNIDLAGRKVDVRGCPVVLTTKEFDLLAYLASRPSVVFSRRELLHSVWQSAPEWQNSTTVTEHIRRLRVKLGDDAGHLITSVRGIGYRFEPPPEVAVEGVRGEALASAGDRERVSYATR